MQYEYRTVPRQTNKQNDDHINTGKYLNESSPPGLEKGNMQK